MNENQTNSADSRQYYARYKFGEREGEFQSHEPDFVNMHAATFLSVASPSRPQQLKLPFPENQNTPLLSDSGVPRDKTNNNPSHSIPDAPGLCEFYRSKSPASQPEQIAVITYYYQKYQGREGLRALDYSNALIELRYVNARSIKNPNDAANKAQGCGWLFRHDIPGKLTFSLTAQGREFVESMNMGTDE